MNFQPDLPIAASAQPPVRILNGASGNIDQQPVPPPQPMTHPIHETLRQHFREARSLPKTSPRHRKLIDRMVVMMQQSGKLWTDKQNPHHEDAESETWLYVIRKLKGDGESAYDPDKGSPITLWNSVYKRKLDELSQSRKNKQTHWEATQRVHPRRDSETGQWQNPIDTVASPEPVPSQLDTVQALIEADPTGKLSRVCLRHDRSHVTVQVLALEIVHRLRRGEPWTLAQLATHFDVPAGTMNSFWSQRCKPLLRELGRSTEIQEGGRVS